MPLRITKLQFNPRSPHQVPVANSSNSLESLVAQTILSVRPARPTPHVRHRASDRPEGRSSYDHPPRFRHPSPALHPTLKAPKRRSTSDHVNCASPTGQIQPSAARCEAPVERKSMRPFAAIVFILAVLPLTASSPQSTPPKHTATTMSLDCAPSDCPPLKGYPQTAGLRSGQLVSLCGRTAPPQLNHNSHISTLPRFPSRTPADTLLQNTRRTRISRE